MITIGKVIHGFVLFVNDTYTSLVSSNCYGFDVFYRFSLLFQVGVDEFSSFDSSLRMELSWDDMLACPIFGVRRFTLPGYETLKRMFSIT